MNERRLLLSSHTCLILAKKASQSGALRLAAGSGQPRTVALRVVLHEAVLDPAVPERAQVGEPYADVSVGGAAESFIEATGLKYFGQSYGKGWILECRCCEPAGRSR